MSASHGQSRVRLDVLLTDRGLFETRSKSAAAVLAGEVFIGAGRERASKPGQSVAEDVLLDVADTKRFVSRGGVKLDNALTSLGIDVSGLRCIDLGASTGGFSDCLLQRGASQVVALDVAYGELAWSLRQDPRVHVMERCNARELELDDLPWQPKFAVCDVSFIAVGKIMQAVARVLPEGADGVLLVKPQFEVGREAVGKGGVVREASVRRRALVLAGESALAAGLGPIGFASSELPGPKGNRETFIHVRKGAESTSGDLLRMAEIAEP